ncbi:short chain dehydrogenase/reductase family oxidoreductase [Xenorhabdus beddingii]|uniref:Short chain dehydrogenase/reductase family oxidoreductase n=1 Tax=Xenorhabdus beddingii TaxID=40578 RepID=A0A1Y2SUA1_9GAMM|nr:SDR family oxidoreductase [Xenorhabdus beddingii]OTA21544.1 short chain dehydrogenase/reductase family oxidoreductase [Xenorhabdus beddingii]
MSISRFSQKNVCITGAGTGIGRAAALRLAAEGANLVLIGRRLEPLNQLAEEVRTQGTKALALSCDIADEQQVKAAFAQAHQQLGNIDGLFANAGVLGDFKPLSEAEVGDFTAPFSTNLIGTFLTIKHCLPFMPEGAILINASWTTGSVMPGTGIYAATKSALLALMRTLAAEVGVRSVRVNAISPGVILTPMAAEALPEEVAKSLAAHSLLLRNGVAEDVAGTVAWLLSEDAGYVTGQEIKVDGGFTTGGMR